MAAVLLPSPLRYRPEKTLLLPLRRPSARRSIMRRYSIALVVVVVVAAAVNEMVIDHFMVRHQNSMCVFIHWFITVVHEDSASLKALHIFLNENKDI